MGERKKGEKMEDNFKVLNLRDRLVLACDANTKRINDFSAAEKLINELGDHVGWIKFNSAFVGGGKKILMRARRQGAKIWLDLKWHDVSDTVVKYAYEAMTMIPFGVEMFNVHASGGSKMMGMVKGKIDELFPIEASPAVRPLAIAITVLTSLGQKGIEEIGYNCTINELVMRLATLTKSAGLNGVVASPLEAKMLRAEFGPDFLIVTPGIRFAEESKGGQIRVTTPKEAIANGADMIVMGTSLINGGFSAVQRAYQEIAEGLEERQKKFE